KEPAGEEMERVMEGVEIYSPDRETSYVVKGEKMYGYILNRHRFGQRLVRMAIDSGAILFDRTQVLGPLMKKKFVNGVLIRNLETREKTSLQSSIVVEATGFFANIRKKLTQEIGIDIKIENEDIEACYREIRQLRGPLNNRNLCQIYIAQRVAPGGYYWIFPEGGTKVNVGLGVAMNEDFPNPKEQLYKYVLSQPMFQRSSIIDKGGWYVPTRRPLDSMVGNGVIIAGDAACQVNPIHGGGIGPSMMGGKLAGEISIEALERDDFSREGLWDYNSRYIREYGAKQAGLEIFRILLQEMSDEDLNYGMQHRLLTEEDVLNASLGKDVHFTVSDKVQRVFRGIKRLNVVRKLKNAADSMFEIKEWYKDYPALPTGFIEWRAGAKKIFQKATVQLTKY
ncbi:MAG: geranylgeranyl hydrogenase, partial [Candidatus Bathyarchaeota archaeon]